MQYSSSYKALRSRLRVAQAGHREARFGRFARCSAFAATRRDRLQISRPVAELPEPPRPWPQQPASPGATSPSPGRRSWCSWSASRETTGLNRPVCCGHNERGLQMALIWGMQKRTGIFTLSVALLKSPIEEGRGKQMAPANTLQFWVERGRYAQRELQNRLKFRC